MIYRKKYKSFLVTMIFIFGIFVNGCFNSVNTDNYESTPPNLTNQEILEFDRIIGKDEMENEEKLCMMLQIGQQPGEIHFSWINTKKDTVMQLFIKEKKSTVVNAYIPTVDHYEDEKIYSYRLKVEGLKPNTEYEYGLMNDENRSKLYQYKTPDYGEEFQFLFAGDPQIREKDIEGNTKQWDTTLLKSLKAFPKSAFLISAGDQVSLPMSELYEGFSKSHHLKSIPLAVNKGNHDVKSQLYQAHFYMPNISEQENYYYQYGKTLFVALNSNDLNYDNHKKFLQMAIDDYKAKNNERHRWLIVTTHHSIYSVGVHALDEDILERRKEFSDIFAKADVDLVLLGHDHCYTRSFLMEQEIPIQKPMPYNEDVKTKGQVLYVTATSSSGSKFYPRAEGEFDYVAVENTLKENQITNIEVTQSAIKIITYSIKDMSIFDEFTLKKELSNER